MKRLSAALLGILFVSACTTTTPQPEPTPTGTSTPAVTTTTVPPTTTSSLAAVTTKPPLPTSAVEDVAQPRYSCEPTAPAKFEDPTNPNVITNKDCPELNAERSRAQQEYGEQVQREASESMATMTDANGETYEEYCTRTGQPLDNCAAG